VIPNKARAFGLLPVLAFFTPSPALADSALRELVPAPACDPTDDASQAKLELVNHAWQFIPGQSGTATLRCPVRGSFFYYDSTQSLVDVVAEDLYLYFMDPDLAGATYNITAHMYRSLKTDGAVGVSLGTMIDSNDSLVVGDTSDYQHLTMDASNHDMLDAQYHVRIVMTRDVTTLNPRFTAVEINHAPAG
jgi:hypothetical protein